LDCRAIEEEEEEEEEEEFHCSALPTSPFPLMIYGNTLHFPVMSNYAIQTT
jgi:hypothetical protein